MWEKMVFDNLCLFKHIKNKKMILFCTQVSVAGLAELPSSTKTEIKRQLIRFAQLASILNGCESILGVVVSHKPVVIPVTEEKTSVFIYFTFQQSQRKNRRCI